MKAISKPWWYQILFAAALVSSALGFVLFLISSYERIFFRYAWNYGEPVVATAVFNVPSKPLIYRFFSEEPLAVLPYNPLYIYFSWFVSLFTGQNFACGRLVSIAAFFGLLLVLRRLLGKEGVDPVSAWALSLFPASIPLFYRYAPTIRMDVMMLFFSTAGVYFFLQREKKDRKRVDAGFWLGVACYTLSFFTKQTGVAVIASTALFFLWRRRLREAIYFTVVQSVLILSISLALNILTHGAYFENTVTANMQSFYWRLFLLSWKNFLPALWPIYLSAAMALVLRRRFGLLEVYFVVALAFTMFSAKIGSDDNYFLESAFLSCVLISLTFAGCATSNFGRTFRVAWLLFMILTVVRTASAFQSSDKASAEEKKRLDEVSSLVKSISGPVICENMGILIALGKPVVYQPFEYTQLAYRKRIPEEPLLSRLKRQEYPLVILTTNPYFIKQSQRFTPDFLDTLLEYYKLYGVLHGHIFYTPRDASAYLNFQNNRSREEAVFSQ